jgi:glutathione S-transferase
MLTVYGRATSSNVQALLWGLEELGLAYDRLDYGEVHGGIDRPEFLALNPHGKIPVLMVGDTALFETGAILRYLASEHGADAFWPGDPLARAQVDMWAEWAKYEVAAAFTGPVFWRHTRTAPERRDAQAVLTALDKFEDQLEIAEPRLAAHAYLCGNRFTLADIQFGHVLYRYFDTDLDRRPLPALAAYYARLSQRAAYAHAVMVSYDSLKDTF